jgi:hypothetical protein
MKSSGRKVRGRLSHGLDLENKVFIHFTQAYLTLFDETLDFLTNFKVVIAVLSNLGIFGHVRHEHRKCHHLLRHRELSVLHDLHDVGWNFREIHYCLFGLFL